MAVRFGPPKRTVTPIPLPPSSLEMATPQDPREPPHPDPERVEVPETTAAPPRSLLISSTR